MSHTGDQGQHLDRWNVSRAECRAKANIASRNLRVQLVPAPGSGEGDLVHPKPGGKGQSEGGSFGIALAQAAALQLLLRAVFQGFPEPFPKGPAPPDLFSCCCTSEWCWIGGMQGADPPGAGASAALPAAPMQWQGTQPAGARRREGEGLCSRSLSCRGAQRGKVSFIPGHRLPAPGCLSPFTAC